MFVEALIASSADTAATVLAARFPLSAGRSWRRSAGVYQGKGFVGMVTVAGPSASKKAVTELGQQACAFAVKSLS